MARIGWAFFFLAALCLGQGSAPPRPEKAAKKAVVDRYHGVEVRDDYRWLEDTASAATLKWVKDQNRTTRAVLDALPAREAIRKQLQP